MRMIVRNSLEVWMSGASSDPSTHDRAPQDWLRVVVERRRALGLRQEDLADLAGVSPRFVQSLEAGKPTVRLDKLEAVLHALGLRIEVVASRRGGS